MVQVYCLDCDHAFELKHPKLGQKVVCPSCGSEMEVIDVDPVELDWVYESIDDDDFDDDDE